METPPKHYSRQVSKLGRQLMACADALAVGLGPQEAMRHAGYSASRAKTGKVVHDGNACRVEDHPIVVGRLKDIESQLDEIRNLKPAETPAEVVAHSKWAAIARLWANADAARADGNRADERHAIMAVAKLEGWIIDRRQDVPLRLEDLTDEQLRQLSSEVQLQLPPVAVAGSDP